MEIGRPTKLTDQVQTMIIDAIKMGNYIETASAYAGVSKTTVYLWLKRGAREIERLEKDPDAIPDPREEIYVIFSNAVQKALAEAEMRDVAIIGKAAEESWQASAWRLERKFPMRWGKREKLYADISHSGEVNQVISLDEQLLHDEEGKELLKKLWRRKMELENENQE